MSTLRDLAILLQMSKNENLLQKLEIQTLKERIQWLEHLCNDFQQKYLDATTEPEPDDTPTEKHIGFN
jgi:hypothetical protein